MRSYAVILALAAVAAAQSSSAAAPQLPTPTSGDPVASSIAAKINDCLENCDATDTTCQAKCVAVPAPNEDQVNETIACSAKCDQGDGSPADTEAFGQCLTKCRNQYYFSEGAGTPEATGASGGSGSGSGSSSGSAQTTGAAATNTSSGDNAEETGDSTDSEAASGSATGDAAASSSTSEPNGAVSLRFTSASLLGLVAAFFL